MSGWMLILILVFAFAAPFIWGVVANKLFFQGSKSPAQEQLNAWQNQNPNL